jgi:hypothetical protein
MAVLALDCSSDSCAAASRKFNWLVVVGLRIKIARHLAALICVLFSFVIQLPPDFAWVNSIFQQSTRLFQWYLCKWTLAASGSLPPVDPSSPLKPSPLCIPPSCTCNESMRLARNVYRMEHTFIPVGTAQEFAGFPDCGDYKALIQFHKCGFGTACSCSVSFTVHAMIPLRPDESDSIVGRPPESSLRPRTE